MTVLPGFCNDLGDQDEGYFDALVRMFEQVRVGLYARVSTHDQQTLSLQMRAMREYAAKRGWTIAVQIKEIGSGAAERATARPDLSRRARFSLGWM